MYAFVFTVKGGVYRLINSRSVINVVQITVATRSIKGIEICYVFTRVFLEERKTGCKGGSSDAYKSNS